ncbi:hypothetical protein, partial [Microvirga tunisiensis]|uniref:hypothetical protein n=1 Tax=Microvirga tunisiensis TaxID=2108360 RepID=UPI001AEDA6AA
MEGSDCLLWGQAFGCARNFSAHHQTTRRKGECSQSTRLLTVGLALRLRNQPSVARSRAATAGGGHGGAAAGADRLAGIAHRRLSVEEMADFVAAQGLV